MYKKMDKSELVRVIAWHQIEKKKFNGRRESKKRDDFSGTSPRNFAIQVYMNRKHILDVIKKRCKFYIYVQNDVHRKMSGGQAPNSMLI